VLFSERPAEFDKRAHAVIVDGRFHCDFEITIANEPNRICWADPVFDQHHEDPHEADLKEGVAVPRDSPSRLREEAIPSAPRAKRSGGASGGVGESRSGECAVAGFHGLENARIVHAPQDSGL